MSGPRSLVVDLRPLREHPGFRRLWWGTTLSAVGSQLTSFAATFVVWDVTRSPVLVGALGLAVAVPLIVFALLGGSVADAVDRRRLVLLTTAGQVATSLGLAALVLLHRPAVWALFLLVGLASALSAVGSPARRTFTAVLLPPERLPAGLALGQMSFQLSILLGPALAGLLTARWGASTCFALDAASFAVALLAASTLPATGRSSTHRPGVGAVAAGLRFVARTPVVAGVFASDLLATVLAMPMALFPVLNQEKFGGSAETLGLFLSAVAVGGVAASALSGTVTHRRRPGLTVLACGAVWGVALAGVGVAGPLPLVLSLLAVAGAADTWSVTARGAVVQLSTPEHLRGRVSALEHLVGAAGPHLGGLRAGLVAAATSGGVAMVSGGLACLAGIALLAARGRQLRSFSTTVTTPR